MLGLAPADEGIVVADLEAGIGTLTRLPQGSVDVALVVAEPTPKSLEVVVRALDLAAERGVGRVIVVANRVRDDDDRARLRAALDDRQVEVVEVPDDPAIVAAERAGTAPLDADEPGPAVDALVEVARRLER